MRIGQTSFIVFASKLVGSALGFLATIYLARELGAEILGFYALVMALTAWFILAGKLGVSKAMTKRISEGDEPASYLAASATLIGVVGTSVGVLVIVFAEYIDAYVGETVALFVVAILFIKLFYNFTNAVLRGERKVHITGILQPVHIGSYSLVQVALVAAGFGLVGMLIGYIVGGILIGIVGLFFVSTGINRPRVRHFKSLIDFAKYAWLGGLKSRSFNDVDILVLGFLVPSALVGVYSIAWSIAKFLELFGSAVSTTLFPELSKADADRSDELVSNLVTDSLAYGGLFIIPGLFGGALLADHLLAIYGPEFVQGATVLVVLILATLLYGYQKQLMNAINAVDRPDLAFRINVVFIVTNVVLNVLLILEFGFVGAAIATALSAGLGTVLSFLALRSLVTFAVPVGEIARQFLAAGVMAAGVYVGLVGFSTAAITHDVAIVVTLVTIGAGVYFVSLLGISAQFRATVAANSPISLPLLTR